MSYKMPEPTFARQPLGRQRDVDHCDQHLIRTLAAVGINCKRLIPNQRVPRVSFEASVHCCRSVRPMQSACPAKCGQPLPLPSPIVGGRSVASSP